MQRRLSALDKGGEWNRLDAMETAFHQRVRDGYHALIKEEPKRWVTINAAQPVEEGAGRHSSGDQQAAEPGQEPVGDDLCVVPFHYPRSGSTSSL